MRIFTIEEANDLLPTVEPILEEISLMHSRIVSFDKEVKAAARVAQFSSGMRGGSNYVCLLIKLIELTTKLNNLGVHLKDYSRGLVDFPTRRNGRVVFLCWQLGEGDKIEWWHDIESGFAGRRHL